jgi:hypothetical protein
MKIEIIKGEDTPVTQFFSAPSSTPETDAAQHEGLLKTNPIPIQVVTANFARKLERERDEAREELRAFTHDKKHLCNSHRDMKGNCMVCQMEEAK